MTRYWVGWWSGNYADEGCTTPKFQTWTTNQRDRPMYGMKKEVYQAMLDAKLDDTATDDYIDKHSRDDCAFCAVIDAEHEDDVWGLIHRHFPDFSQRFIEEKDLVWQPPGQFSNFENKTRA